MNNPVTDNNCANVRYSCQTCNATLLKSSTHSLLLFLFTFTFLPLKCARDLAFINGARCTCILRCLVLFCTLSHYMQLLRVLLHVCIVAQHLWQRSEFIGRCPFECYRCHDPAQVSSTNAENSGEWQDAFCVTLPRVHVMSLSAVLFFSVCIWCSVFSCRTSLISTRCRDYIPTVTFLRNILMSMYFSTVCWPLNGKRVQHIVPPFLFS